MLLWPFKEWIQFLKHGHLQTGHRRQYEISMLQQEHNQREAEKRGQGAAERDEPGRTVARSEESEESQHLSQGLNRAWRPNLEGSLKLPGYYDLSSTGKNT